MLHVLYMSEHQWSGPPDERAKRMCDGCMGDATDSFTTVKEQGSYFSEFPTDGSSIHFDLCQHCLSAIVATLKWSFNEADYMHDTDGKPTPYGACEGPTYGRVIEVRAGRLLFGFQDCDKRWLTRVKESPFYRRGSMKAVEGSIAIRVEVSTTVQWAIVKDAAPWLDERTVIDRVGFVWRNDSHIGRGRYSPPPKTKGPSLESQMRALKKLEGIKTWSATSR